MSYFEKYKIKLGVNIDHIATLRNARRVSYPDPLQAAILAKQYGADMITVHLREDRRHIQDSDLYSIQNNLRNSVNLECSLNKEMLNIAYAVKPYAICFVPERREEITTESGLDVIQYFEEIKSATNVLKNAGIIVSIFIDPKKEQIIKAKETGATSIELHTGKYACSIDKEEQKEELFIIQCAARFACSMNLEVNAGHGLTEENVFSIAKILEISTLNIGHSIVCQAIFKGWKSAILDMKRIIQKGRKQSLKERRIL